MPSTSALSARGSLFGPPFAFTGVGWAFSFLCAPSREGPSKDVAISKSPVASADGYRLADRSQTQIPVATPPSTRFASRPRACLRVKQRQKVWPGWHPGSGSRYAVRVLVGGSPTARLRVRPRPRLRSRYRRPLPGRVLPQIASLGEAEGSEALLTSRAVCQLASPLPVSTRARSRANLAWALRTIVQELAVPLVSKCKKVLDRKRT